MTTENATLAVQRRLQRVTSGQPAMDGAGVKMTRIIGTPGLNMLDPFLLLDNFESDRSEDYIGGFPAHPHRGFATVTYLLAGRMRHKDSVGHEGVIAAGDVQWMTAGRGIVHSEMPEQENGLLQGFQLWVNLPASEKMCAPDYQEFAASEMGVEEHKDGSVVRVIAGTTDRGTKGPVSSRHVSPTFMDVSLKDEAVFAQTLAASDQAFVFVITGTLRVGAEAAQLSARQLGILSEGEMLSVQAKGDARFLLVAARPLHEPVARGGPFVMNTEAEVMQAFEDYRSNRFIEAG